MPWFKFDGSLSGALVPLRGAPLAVFVAAALSADQNGITQMSLTELARTTGYSRRAVIKAVNLLERSTLLTLITTSPGARVSRQVHRCFCWGSAQPVHAPLAELWQAVAPDDEETFLPWPTDAPGEP